MEKALLVEGGGCMYRAVQFCLSCQDLGFQSMAVPKVCIGCLLLTVLEELLCFHSEAKEVWGIRKQAQEQNSSLYIYTKMLG